MSRSRAVLNSLDVEGPMKNWNGSTAVDACGHAAVGRAVSCVLMVVAHTTLLQFGPMYLSGTAVNAVRLRALRLLEPGLRLRMPQSLNRTRTL